MHTLLGKILIRKNQRLAKKVLLKQSILKSIPKHDCAI